MGVQTVPVTVDGNSYDVSWKTGTFNEVNETHDLTAQPWWGDEYLTGVFAEALGFRHSTSGELDLVYHPYFAYKVEAYSDQILDEVVWSRYFDVNSDIYFDRADPYGQYISWAYAVPVPEPATISLLVLGVIGFWFSRRRKIL